MDVQKFDDFSTTIIFEIGRKLINLTTTWRATCTAINAYVTIQISLILCDCVSLSVAHVWRPSTTRFTDLRARRLHLWYQSIHEYKFYLNCFKLQSPSNAYGIWDISPMSAYNRPPDQEAYLEALRLLSPPLADPAFCHFTYFFFQNIKFRHSLFNKKCQLWGLRPLMPMASFAHSKTPCTAPDSLNIDSCACPRYTNRRMDRERSLDGNW